MDVFLVAEASILRDMDAPGAGILREMGEIDVIGGGPSESASNCSLEISLSKTFEGLISFKHEHIVLFKASGKSSTCWGT